MADRPSDPPEHDPGEVIAVAGELMDADREKALRVDPKEIGDELGVPPEYIDKAILEVEWRSAEKARHLRVIVAAGCAVVVMGAALFLLSRSAASRLTVEQAQESRCRGDLGIDRIGAQVGATLAVPATCRIAGAPYVIAPGPNRYYGANLRCTFERQPSPERIEAFSGEMEAAGYPGYKTQRDGAAIAVLGTTTSRPCRDY